MATGGNSGGKKYANNDEPVRDYGNTGVLSDSSGGKQKWEEQQALYIGLRYPEDNKKRKHRRKSRSGSTKNREQDPDAPPPAYSDRSNRPVTPPGERVANILGRDEDDDDESHETHDLFSEMVEVRPMGDDGELQWKETARWIKFEEDVEEGGERWSKPHVATLSLHSLFELRKSLLSGIIALDMDAPTIEILTENLVEQMANNGVLEFQHKDKMTEILLAKTWHQHQQKDKGGLPVIRSLADIGRKMSARNLEHKDSHASVPGMGGDKGAFNSISINLANILSSSGGMGATLNIPGGSAKDLTTASSADLTDPIKYNQHFLKKIPAGAEAANILIGEIDFLQSDVVAFVRLQKAAILGDITEVPVPTKFLFLLVGPTGERNRYHEIGRSIGTLMSDEIFHDVAYKARDIDDILSAIDEFLDCVTVLPPGEWDPTIRIEPPKSVPSQEKRKKPALSLTNSGGAGGGDGGDANGGKGGMPNGKADASPVEAEEQHGDPTLVFTGRFCGGLITDIKRKIPFFASDFTDALHVQTIAAIFFMYFASLTPIITFGGLLGAATGNYIAAMESLMSGAICGVVYHLFSGQPLTIIGSTGPVLVFETIVYNFCESYGWVYLEFRFWIGFWMCIWLLLLVMFDCSALVRFITRFTEESFAMLIAIIFIYEAFNKLFHGLEYYPVNLNPSATLDYDCNCTQPNMSTLAPKKFAKIVNKTIAWENFTREECTKNYGELVGSGCATPLYKPDIFFFTCLLFIGTFTLSLSLKNFRNTRFFPNKVRVMISDFAVFLAICTMVLVDRLVGLDTKKLNVPENIRPTNEDREGWIVNPFLFHNPWWNILAGIPPSLLSTILIFMDQQITAVIVNRKEHKLKKGGGYHLDLLIITVEIFICTVIGTPWFVAATVLSINHVRSLTIESEAAAPGERPKFLGIREQRVTGIIVFILVGVSAFMSKVLKLIPMAVLYGVFLYMGISSIKGIQLMQRFMIMFMPSKYQPDYLFLRNVRTRRVHLFTVIQLLCLGGLCVIKEIHSISIIFPLMVLAMCFIRKGLDYVFTQHELKWLDDIMPDSHKQEKEKKKKALLNASEAEAEADNDEGEHNIAGVSKDHHPPHSMNISEEMAKTSIWRQLSSSDDKQLKQRKAPKSEADVEKGQKAAPVKFKFGADDDGETEAMLKGPQIFIEAPSNVRGDSPTNV